MELGFLRALRGFLRDLRGQKFFSCSRQKKIPSSLNDKEDGMNQNEITPA
jgi:hypothetical protein